MVSGLSGARYSRPHRPRGAPTATSARGGHDNSNLDLHAHASISLEKESAEQKGEQSGASTSNTASGNFAPEGGVPASTASTTTQQQKREGNPPRLVIEETLAKSQEAIDLVNEGVHTRSQ